MPWHVSQNYDLEVERGGLALPQRVKFGDPPKDSEKRGESMGAEHSPAVAPRRWRPERKVLANSV